jgi:SH3 domain protein
VKIFSFILISILLSGNLYAESVRYISDTNLVPLRGGPGSKYRILHKGLVSGTRLTAYEQTDNGIYTRVKTSRGTEGWIRTQYLMNKPAAKDLLKAANARATKFQDANKQLKADLSKLKQSKQTTDKDLSQLTTAHSKLNDQLIEIKKLSGRAIELNRDNTRLLQENEALKNQLDVVTADNQRLDDEADSDAFMNGAFAVFPRMMPKKKTDWA